MASSLPCIFCAEATPFSPNAAKGPSSQELVFKYLCDLLKVYPGTVLPFPVCALCTRVYGKLAILKKEFERVEKEIGLVSTQLRDKIIRSSQSGEGAFVAAATHSENNPHLKMTLNYVKSFRDTVWLQHPQLIQTNVSDELGNVIYVASIADLESLQQQGYTTITTTDPTSSSTTVELHHQEVEVEEHHEFGDGCEDITVVAEEVVASSSSDPDQGVGNYETKEPQRKQRKRGTVLGRRSKSPRRKKSKMTRTIKTAKDYLKKSPLVSGSMTKDKPLRKPSESQQGCPYKCDQCSWSFDMPHKLKNHLATHSGKRLFRCNSCNQEFSNFKWLKGHNEECHGTAWPHKCDKCGKKYVVEAGLTRHKGGHVESLECKVCADGIVFKSSHNLRRHMKIHNQSSSQTNLCSLCPATFIRREDMVGHMVRIHRGETGTLTCNLCTKQYENAIDLVTHIYAHSGLREIKCQACSNLFSTKDELLLHNEEKHNLPVTRMSCGKCDAVLLSDRSFRLHQKLHEPITATPIRAPLQVDKTKTFQCCKQKFDSRSALIQHRKLLHKEPEGYKCEKCGLVFDDEASLQEHTNNHPEGETLTCGICDKTFRSIANYRRHHNYTHRKIEKQYKCLECPYETKRKDDLHKHERIMHVVTGEKGKLGTTSTDKDRTCEPCEKTFQTKGSYLRHLRNRHSSVQKERFECAHCPRTFQGRNGIMMHLVVHDESRRRDEESPLEYKCELCGRNFISLQNLNRHIKIIHNFIGRPYVCDLCHKTYKRKDDAYKHFPFAHEGYDRQDHIHFKPSKLRKPVSASSGRASTSASTSTNIQKKQRNEMTITENLDDLKCHNCQKYFHSVAFLKEHQTENPEGSCRMTVVKREQRKTAVVNRVKVKRSLRATTPTSDSESESDSDVESIKSEPMDVEDTLSDVEFIVEPEPDPVVIKRSVSPPPAPTWRSPRIRTPSLKLVTYE